MKLGEKTKTGKLDDIDSVEKWRYEELKNLGIDFVKSFDKFDQMI